MTLEILEIEISTRTYDTESYFGERAIIKISKIMINCRKKGGKNPSYAHVFVQKRRLDDLILMTRVGYIRTGNAQIRREKNRTREKQSTSF